MIDRVYLEQLRQRQFALESDLSNPATAANQTKYRELVQEHTHTKRLVEVAERYLSLQDRIEENRQLLQDEATDAELAELARGELTELDAQFPLVERALKLSLLPPSPDDSRNTIMEIRAGTGGEEAALFAGDLYRMYARYAEGRGWKVSILDASPGTRGGYKEIIFSVEGENVYRTLRYESGGHRVQRVPITEASGRIHTSAATVAVLAEADEIDEIEIRAEDIRVDVYRSSGPGGQSVNTTDSAVRITHVPTGLVVQSQEEKSQHRNKDKAMRMLRARLLDLKRSEEEAKEADIRRTQIGSGDRSQRIRTYNFPQNRMTDHRINLTVYNLDRLIEGELDELLDALYEHDMELKLKARMGGSTTRGA
jgi:peptide chain release factor 1